MDLDIIGNIRSLEGDNLGIIFKKFVNYLISNNDAITSDIKNILSSFIPQDNLQKILKIKMIDKWNVESEIFKILENEDVFYISQALKCKWFFTCINLDCHYFVNEMLPNVSCSIRFKLIQKYAKYLKDVTKAEHIYQLLKERYGSECAVVILPACRPNFIYDVLISSGAQIRNHTIVLIYRLHPNIIIEFFSYVLECQAKKKRIFRNFKLDNYLRVFQLIAAKKPEIFIDLFVKYNRYIPYFQLGHRTTKRIINTNAELVIKEYKIFKNIIKEKRMLRCLNISQIEEIQALCFPKTVSMFFGLHWEGENLHGLTKHLKEDVRYEILFKNFKKCYGKDLNIDDFSNVFDLNMILLVPVEIRIKWIQSKLPTLETDNKKAEYLRYLPPDIALPAIKAMIGNQKETNTRVHMVKCMLHSATLYKDKKQLIDCVNFVIRRLRNDNVAIREKVLDELNCEILLKFTVEDWKPIDELIDLSRMNDDRCDYLWRNVFVWKIKNYFYAGLPTDDLLKNYFEFEISENHFYLFQLCYDTPYHKKCLEFFLKALLAYNFEKDEYRKEAETRLFCSMCDYNKANKHDVIEYPEWLLENMEKHLLNDEKEHEYSYYEISNVLSTIRNDPKLRDRFYIKLFPNIISNDSVIYLLRNKPLIIKEQHDLMMNKILKHSYLERNYITFFKKVTLYTPLSLPKLLTENCLKRLNSDSDSDSSDSTKPNLISILSILMPTTDFIKVIIPYKPTKDEIEAFSGENRLVYRIQREIASSLKHITEPSKILYYLKDFTIGDYLKLIVNSISSICLKVPEKNILPLLIGWMDCRVSLRKHFIRAYYKVAPIADTGKLIITLLNKEKNISLRLLLLEHIYKHFLADPCEETFTIFKTGFSQLTQDDLASLENLFDLNKIPDLFVSSFTKMLWKAVELKEGPLLIQNKMKIINMLDTNILSMLEEDFCDQLINFVLNANQPLPHTFITIYLLVVPNENIQMNRYDKILQYITSKLLHEWDAFNINKQTVFETRNEIYNLITNLCQECELQKTSEVNPQNILNKLKSFFQSLIPDILILDEILLLDITIFIISCDLESDNFINQLAKYLEEILNKYCDHYGDKIIETVAKSLPNSIEKHKLNLVKILLTDYKTYPAHLLALELIDTYINDDLPDYKIVIELLLKNDNPHVRAAAGQFFRNLCSKVFVS